MPDGLAERSVECGYCGADLSFMADDNGYVARCGGGTGVTVAEGKPNRVGVGGTGVVIEKDGQLMHVCGSDQG